MTVYFILNYINNRKYLLPKNDKILTEKTRQNEITSFTECLYSYAMFTISDNIQHILEDILRVDEFD